MNRAGRQDRQQRKIGDNSIDGVFVIFFDIDVQFFTNPDLYHLDALIALKFDFDELFLNGPVSINLNYKARWFKS